MLSLGKPEVHSIMGKWSEAVPAPTSDLGRFVDAEDKDALEGEPLRLERITFDSRNQYGPRWIVSAYVLTTGEKVAIGLASNPNRDAIMDAGQAALARDEALDPVMLYQQAPTGGGNPFWAIRDATDAELSDAESRKGADPLFVDTAPATPTVLPKERLAKAARK